MPSDPSRRHVQEVHVSEKLRDGSEVDIRRLRPTDAPVLAEAFEQLSSESRRLRFIGPKPSLSPRELAYLTDVDGHDHEALGASDHVTGRGVGVARFIRLADEPEVAEVAVTVDRRLAAPRAWERCCSNTSPTRPARRGSPTSARCLEREHRGAAGAPPRGR